MRIAVVGGGPGGLYFAALAKQLDPTRRDRRSGSATPPTTRSASAWSSPTRPSAASSTPTRSSTRRWQRDFARWDDIDVAPPRARATTSGGHGFAAMSRTQLLEILQRALRRARRRACTSGPRPRTPTGCADDYDLVVAADGAHSAIARAVRRRVRPDRRDPRLQVHLARHRPGLRRFQLLHRGDAARRHADPRLPVRRDGQHLHRRDAR